MLGKKKKDQPAAKASQTERVSCVDCDGKGLDLINPTELCQTCKGSGKVTV